MTDTRRQTPDRRDLTAGPLTRTLLRLAIPVAAGSVLQALYSLVDAFWLGRWSKDALAAPGVSMPFLFLVITFGMGFSNAGTALVAQYTGAGRHREASRAAAQSILLLCFLAVCMACPIAVFAPHLFRLVRVPGNIGTQAIIYIRVMMIGVPFVAFHIGYGSVLRALGDTITIVILGAAGNVLNLVLDPVLIFGLGGLPALGVGGAALASLISQCLMALACFVLLRRRHAGLDITPTDVRPDPAMLRRILGVGIPNALGNSSNSLGFVVFQTMVNSLGAATVTACTIGFRIIHFFTVPTWALSSAATPIVGQALGAGKPHLARRVVWLSAGIVAVTMFLPTLFLALKGGLVAWAFVDDPDVILEARRFFLIVPFSAYIFSVLMVLLAAFYGSGHTRPAMFLSMARLWLFRLPASYLMGFVLGWGSRGVYAGMVFGNIAVAAIAFMLFVRGGWETGIVPPSPEDTVEEGIASEDAADSVTERVSACTNPDT